MIINGVDVTDMVKESAMPTRLEKIKAEDEKLQHTFTASSRAKVARWMIARGYTIPQGYDVDMDCLLSAIATQAAERGVMPARVPFELRPGTADGDVNVISEED